MTLRNSSYRGGVGFLEGTTDLLHDVLHYELGCAERYRRFVSVVMVRAPHEEGPVRRLIADKLRTSDLLSEKNTYLTILMSETDGPGAHIAIDRFKSGMGDHDLRFSLVTFPQDSGSAESLVETAARRLTLAGADGPGSIVSKG